MEDKKSKVLNISLWVAQTILAVLFLMAGSMKSFQPIETLSQTLPWVSEMPTVLIRFIGISELLGGLGLILPGVLRIKPKLVGYAALGLFVVMILAACYHVMKSEYDVIGTNVLFGGLAAFIAWGRLRYLPIREK